MESDLDQNVSRGSEAIQREPPARRQIAPLEGPVANDAGAQQWRRIHVPEDRREVVRKCLGDNRVLGVAAVGMVAGELRLFAEVFVAGRAERTVSAGRAQPSAADPLSDSRGEAAFAQGVDAAHDLVAGNHRHVLPRQVALDDVQIGSANRAAAHLDADFTRARIGRRQVHKPQRRGRNGGVLFEQHGFHGRRPMLNPGTMVIRAMTRRSTSTSGSTDRVWSMNMSAS